MVPTQPLPGQVRGPSATHLAFLTRTVDNSHTTLDQNPSQS